MTTYYKINIKALPVGLVWSWGNPRSFLEFLVRKALPFPAYGPTLVPDELSILEVTEAEADADLAADAAEHRTQLEALGYRTALVYKVRTLGPSRGLARALFSSDRRALCVLTSVRMFHRARVSTRIVSYADDGRVVGTSSSVPRLPPVPGIDVERLPAASAGTVARHHERRLASFPAKHLDPGEVIPLIREHQLRARDYYVAEGIWVPATEADVARASRS